MVDHIDVEAATVVTAGHHTAGTADDWGSWGDRIRSAFDTAREELHDARIRSRMETYAAGVERGARYVGSNVEALGGSTVSASNAVHNSDVDAETVLARQGQAGGRDGIILHRPINSGTAIPF